jgi:hypothetical protein
MAEWHGTLDMERMYMFHHHQHLRASPPSVSLHALLTPLRTRGSAARTTMLYAWACVTGLYINEQVQQKVS